VNNLTNNLLEMLVCPDKMAGFLVFSLFSATDINVRTCNKAWQVIRKSNKDADVH